MSDNRSADHARGILSGFERVDELGDLRAEVERLRAEVQRHEEGLPCYCPKCGSCGETGCCGLKCFYLPEHTQSAKWYEDEIGRLQAEVDALKAARAEVRERIARRVARIGDQCFEWDSGTDNDREWAYHVADQCLATDGAQ